MNAGAWALGRALQYAAATAVVALIAAILFPGDDAERFATTAYVAAIVAALVLALKWFLPQAPAAQHRGPAFPAIFTFSLWVALFLIVGGAFVSQPGAEVRAVAACFGLIGAGAIVRAGTIGAIGGKLARGDRLAAATRYAIATAIVALGAGAWLASGSAEGLVRLAYAATVVATVAVAASMLAPTRAGAFAMQTYSRAAVMLKTPASAEIFARTTEYAVAVAIAALVLAALTPQLFAERFATAAYLAILFAGLGIAVKWRLERLGVQSAVPVRRTPRERAKFVGAVALLLFVGLVCGFSLIAETLAACACLYAIGFAIVKRAGAVDAK